jgi:hypothetical protein
MVKKIQTMIEMEENVRNSARKLYSDGPDDPRFQVISKYFNLLNATNI